MTWQADLAHSTILFSVKHMMISTARGRFEKFDVVVDFNEQEPARSSIRVQIEAASINTNDPKRDAHLKSPDFLDVKNYPTIVFVSKRIDKIDDQHGRIVGDLTIRDITQEVVLDVEYSGQMKSPWGAISVGASAQTTINRKYWNLTWNQALETGGTLVGDKITINIEVELVKQPELQAEAVA
jgi:polyisoprenoid-binding protein YceI